MLILHRPDRKALEERLLSLRRTRARTKPLEPSQRIQVLRTRLLFVGGWLVMAALIVAAVAIVLWPPF